MVRQRKPGRPKKLPGERKSYTLRIRITGDQQFLFERAAEGNVSAWARDVLLRAATRRRKK